MATYFHQHGARHFSSRALLIGVAGALSLVVVPAAAQAATRSGIAVAARHADTGIPAALKTSLCDKVSAASISAIIGYKVPAGTGTTFNIKPTKANYEISGTNIVCTYGTASSMSALLKDVSLSFEVISKPLTTAEMQNSIKEAAKEAKFTFVPYSGQGVTGYYFKLTEAGITGQGITGVEDSTHFFGASVESKTVSKSSLGALAKLASKL
jgi:hypothetical protein